MSNCNIYLILLIPLLYFMGKIPPRSITKLIKDQGIKIATAAATAATATYAHRGVCVSELLCDDDDERNNKNNKVLTAAAITTVIHKNKETRRRLSLEQLQLNGYVSFAEGLARRSVGIRNVSKAFENQI